jgi:hypothetical protein
MLSVGVNDGVVGFERQFDHLVGGRLHRADLPAKADHAVLTRPTGK